MADYNRNRGNSYRSQQEWDRDSDQNDRWNEGSSGQWSSQMNDDNSRGYMRSGRRYDDQNQWNRDSGSGRMSQDRESHYSSGSNMDNNFGYGGREYGSSYGGGNYRGENSYYDRGSYGQSNRPSYGSGRNLYDRDYEGFSRNEGYRNNMGSSGIGGSNYGSYGTYGNYDNEGKQHRSYDENPFYGSSNMRNYRGSDYGNYYGRSRGDQHDPNDRSWWNRTKDEVSSWFGDEEAERRRERDMRNSHRGKGPRNYSRSDDRIKEDVNDRLSDDPWVDASEIDVTVNNGEVTLTGTVNNRSDKRRAEDLAEAVSGVKNVENRIRAGRTSDMNTGMGGSYNSGTSGSQSGVTGSTTTDKAKNKSSFVSNT
ncbi:MAG TPA: BON domain-containing protein [Chryseosolibacter sp.]|nr:BON domain-containing protein [Chryseosolibacter sp.]